MLPTIYFSIFLDFFGARPDNVVEIDADCAEVRLNYTHCATRLAYYAKRVSKHPEMNGELHQ